MNELSTEVKAKETHEKAVGYFKVSEQYGYKFIMEVKKIRDDRYYRELGFNTFEDYCKNAWGFSRRWVDMKIQSASNLNESDFEKYTSQIGNQKTFLLATMEDEQREQATEKGIPTDEGYKSVDEATQKEIAEYRKNTDEAIQKAEQAERRAKQAESQAETERKERERLERENEELANREPEVITRTEEIIPEHVSAELEQLERVVESQKLAFDEAKRELETYRLRDANSYDEEEARKEIQKLSDEADKSVLRFKIKVDRFIEEVAITSFMEGAIASCSDPTKKKLQDSVDYLKSFTKKMESTLRGRVEL
ncbi:MAG TPA: hypothetical protein VK067_04575 [Pseudogracilibacillus sp.]|nr:hypothetical protein [Pseudogracilibacillus sp.]